MDGYLIKVSIVQTKPNHANKARSLETRLRQDLGFNPGQSMLFQNYSLKKAQALKCSRLSTLQLKTCHRPMELYLTKANS